MHPVEEGVVIAIILVIEGVVMMAVVKTIVVVLVNVVDVDVK